MSEIRFELSGDCLYAANSGRGFDRTGVVSICSQHLSAKSSRADKIATLDCPDDELVAGIRALRIQLYTLDPNLVIADRNAEDETSRDYAGRCLLELLQNADDAMAPQGAQPAELIGAKGLGFKSVLEISDTPQIFSGPFSFGFDQSRSRACLSGLAVGQEVSVFRLPHEEERDAVVGRLLGQGYAAVVKLPLRNAAAKARVETELAALSPHFLLLSQHLERVAIELPQLHRLLQRKGGRGSPDGAEASLQVRHGRNVEHESSWRVWREVWPAPTDKQKRLSVAMAIRLVHGKLTPTSEPLPLHVFYPTDEQLGSDLLIHAAFDVTQNRQRIRTGDHDAALLARIGAMTAGIAAREPALEVLQVFRRLIAAAPRGKPKLLPRLIPYAVRQALIDTPFVPVVARRTRHVAPASARTSATGFAGLLNPAKQQVADADIARGVLEPVQSILQELESRPLDASDYAALFRHARCSSVAECLAGARVMLRTCLSAASVAPATLAALKEAPIWPVEGGAVRPLSGSRPLLVARPDDWPDWCGADALDPDFAAELFSDGVIPKEWEKLVSGALLTTSSQYLEQCVAPSVAAWTDDQWSQLGWDALGRVEQWAAIGEWLKLKPYAPQAKLGATRDALVKVMRVPSGRTWMRARCCYARTEINGPASLSRHFKPVPGRGLCGFPSQAKSRYSAERWRALLRYLGVSWEPKILLLENDPDQTVGGPDQQGYRDEIYRNDGIRYLKLDWHLEGFPECLGGSVPPATLMEMIAAVHMTSADLRAEWFKVTGTDKTHLPSPYQSLVQFQLRSLPYLPVKPNILGRRIAEGRETFWPQSGVRGITPTLDLTGFKDPRRSALRPALFAALKYQTKLPDRWEAWLGWNDALVAAVERGDVPGGLRSAREFYELMLDPKHGGRDGRKPAKVACADSSSPTGLKSVPRGEATWIDRPALAAPDVLDALGAAGMPYLPALLGTAPDASGQLGVTRASRKVVVLPAYSDAPAGQLKLERRLDARWRAIAVQCEAKRVKLPAKPRLRAVQGMTLTISLDGNPITEIASTSFKEGDDWLIDISNAWEAIATALSDGIGHAADLRYRFAAVLHAPNIEAVSRLLLEDGIPSYKLATLKLDGDPEDDEDVVGSADGSGAPEANGGVENEPAGAANDESDSGSAGPPPPLAPPPAPPPPPPPTQPDRPAGNQFASGKLSHRPLYDAPTKNGSGSGGGPWGAQQSAGIAAEEWLRRLVLDGLPPGWTVALNERDEAAGESDIVVRSPVAEWHIEVKALSSERLYWSELERHKAERQMGRYWMCFLVRQAYAWRIHWSWNPLVDLLECERRVQWQWNRESEGPKLAKNSWEPTGGTGAPMIPPDRATNVIRILDEHVRALPEDDTALTLFWQRVHSKPEKTAAT